MLRFLKTYAYITCDINSMISPLEISAHVLLYCEEMAKLSREDILKLAQLARLGLTDDEVTEFSTELTAILQYVEQLSSVDVEGLAPTSQVTGLTNVTRADEVVDYGYEPLDLLKNVPITDNNQIKVKRMIG